MVKSMGERTPPCGTPDLNCRFVDVWFLNGMGWLKPVATVLLMLCSAVFVFEPCCVVVFGMLCVMHEESPSQVFLQ